jgi:hypothetical protein
MHRRGPPRPFQGSLRDILGDGRVAGDSATAERRPGGDPVALAHERDRRAGLAAGQASHRHLIGPLR